MMFRIPPLIAAAVFVILALIHLPMQPWKIEIKRYPVTNSSMQATNSGKADLDPAHNRGGFLSGSNDVVSPKEMQNSTHARKAHANTSMDGSSPQKNQSDYLEYFRNSGRTNVGQFYKHDLGCTVGNIKDNDAKPLLYIFVPKAGSTTMRSVMSLHARATKKAFKKQIRIRKVNTSNYVTFSFVRDPIERLVSAYSTLTSRFGWGFARCKTPHPDNNSTTLKAPPKPADLKDMEQWKKHFVDSINMWVDTIIQYGWNEDCAWNEHLVPQVEFLKGYHVQHVGCVKRMDETLQHLNLTYDNNKVDHNSYQKGNGMPKEKFTSSDVLSEETKAKIRRAYDQDETFYRTFCPNSAVPVPETIPKTTS